MGMCGLLRPSLSLRESTRRSPTTAAVVSLSALRRRATIARDGPTTYRLPYPEQHSAIIMPESLRLAYTVSPSLHRRYELSSPA